MDKKTTVRNEPGVSCRDDHHNASTAHRCRTNESSSDEENCCEKRKRKREGKKKTVQVVVNQKTCRLPKPDTVRRDCLSKEEYLNLLAKPKKKCDDDCGRKEVTRRLRPNALRIEELALPTRRRVMMTLMHKGATLSPNVVDNMISILEQESALTPEQAENLVKDQQCRKKMKKRHKTHGYKTKDCQKRKRALSSESLDMKAVNCQYAMARRFVKSILACQPDPAIPPTEYKDITSVILCRLGKELNYDVITCEDRNSQQMRILADVLARWISGVLMDVSENRREELMKECERRRRELQELDDRDWFGELEDEKCEDESEEEAEEEYDDESRCEIIDTDNFEVQVELNFTVTEEKEIQVADSLAGSIKEEILDVEMEAMEASPVVKQEPISNIETVVKEETDVLSLEKHEPVRQTDDVSCMTEGESDLSFITFAKVFETLYCMIEREAENTLECSIDNRIHRVIYEKFEELIRRENLHALEDERLKDIVNVTTGKIAVWLRKTLNEKQISFLCEKPADVESREVRQWADWYLDWADKGICWTEWLNRKISESRKLIEKSVTRGEWKDFTQELESKALLWRREFLEAQHQGHHNSMMMADRKVLKTKK